MCVYIIICKLLIIYRYNILYNIINIEYRVHNIYRYTIIHIGNRYIKFKLRNIIPYYYIIYKYNLGIPYAIGIFFSPCIHI